MNIADRIVTILAFIIAAIMGLAMFGGGLIVVAMMLDGFSKYNSDHERCLKHATNGYEIKQCR